MQRVVILAVLAIAAGAVIFALNRPEPTPAERLSDAVQDVGDAAEDVVEELAAVAEDTVENIKILQPAVDIFMLNHHCALSMSFLS